MSGEMLRFVHASDFHLELPLSGLPEVPEALRDLLIDAPYHAATRVFDAALSEHADFLLLTGDLLDPLTSGPRALAFLLEQFERCQARGLAVYWAGGRVDAPEGWPATVPLPSNVHVFPAGKLEEITHLRDDQAHAAILGLSWSERLRIHASEFRGDGSERFRIAMAYGNFEAAALSPQPIHYWALGGEHQRRTLFASPFAAHYPGTPQGRNPRETGAHGCTLVSVDTEGKIRTQLLPTDSIRWHEEHVHVAESATRADLDRQIRDRMQTIVADAGERAVLVSWRLSGAERLATSLRHGTFDNELVDMLRNEYGRRRNPAWTYAFELEPPEALPQQWYEEDSILGDFLRAARAQDAGEGAPLRLSNYLTDAQAAGVYGRALEVSDPAARQRLLREAAALGVDLLRGEVATEA